MNFNLVKKQNKKINLWMGTIGFSFLVIALVIIFVLNGIPIKIRTIVAMQFLINILLVWFLIVGINFSSLAIGYLFHVATFSHPQTHELKAVKFIFNPWIHFWIIGISLLIWFIEVCGFMIQTQNLVLAFKNYWWVCLILFGFNLLFFYTNFEMEKYLYNQISEKLMPDLFQDLKK